jgi:site-specific recombinase XerD
MAKTGSKLITIQPDLNPFSLVSDFICLRKSQGLTLYTIASFKSSLSNFFMEYRGSIKDGKKLKQYVAIFLADKKAGYHNKLLQALRQFFDFCIGEGILKENPCHGIRFKRYSVRIVDHDEKTIRALLAIPDKKTFAGLRDYTIILTILDTGIRPNELLQIGIKDIDFINSQITVREEYSKTRQIRILPLSERVVQAIKKVIAARHEDWDSDIPIFCSFSGHRMTTHNLQEKFRQYSGKLGTGITPYHLRHVFALWFIRNGGNPFALQKIMGHTKLEMTKTYVELAQADIKNNHDTASPINNLFNQSKRVRRAGVCP